MATKKAKPRKSASSKKATSAKEEVAAPTPVVAPPMLEREDQLVMQLAYSEVTNKQLLLQNATREMEKAKTNWDKQLNAVNAKYGLNPAADKIDLATGVIQKG